MLPCSSSLSGGTQASVHITVTEAPWTQPSPHEPSPTVTWLWGLGALKTGPAKSLSGLTGHRHTAQISAEQPGPCPLVLPLGLPTDQLPVVKHDSEVLFRVSEGQSRLIKPLAPSAGGPCFSTWTGLSWAQ